MIAKILLNFYDSVSNYKRCIFIHMLAYQCLFAPNHLAADTTDEKLKKVIVDSISECWNIDNNNQTNVTVRIHLDRNGKVLGKLDVYLIDATAGDKQQVLDAYNSARRSILRCQKGGFDLPMNDYERWKTIEIMFDKSNSFFP